MNHQYQEKLTAKKVAQLNLDLCKNKVEVVNIKNNVKMLEEKIKEFEDTQLSKEQLKLKEMCEEKIKIYDNLCKIIKSESNEIFNITDSNCRKSIEELKCESSQQRNLHENHIREWMSANSKLEKSKDELSIFITHKVNHNQKEKLEEYNLLNLEHLEKLLKERKTHWGANHSPFHNRFAPSKKLCSVNPHYPNISQNKPMIENIERIDIYSQEIVNTYQRLLDNLNEMNSKIDEIDRDSNEHNANLEQLEIKYNEKNNELIKMKNENNKITDKILQAQNNVNIVSFEIKVDEIKNKIQILKDSLNELQRNKTLNNQIINYLELINPYWEAVVNANSELTSKEEEIWMYGNKSRELQMNYNNYHKILSNINQYRTVVNPDDDDHPDLRIHPWSCPRPGAARLLHRVVIPRAGASDPLKFFDSHFTECVVRELKMLDEQFDFNKNFKEYTEKYLYDKDYGFRLFCTLIKKYEIDYTEIITNVNKLEELESLIKDQDVISQSLSEEKYEMNRIKIEKDKQIENFEIEIIPKLMNELEDAKTLWELEKAYLEFEKASNELDNIK